MSEGQVQRDPRVVIAEATADFEGLLERNWDERNDLLAFVKRYKKEKELAKHEPIRSYIRETEERLHFVTIQGIADDVKTLKTKVEAL